MRFIHTADWQIGKVFQQFGIKEEGLRQARLAAIERIGRAAISQGVAHILVAGDIFDSESPGPVTLRAPLERMKQFLQLHWHLLPGNHDPHRPEGIWDRIRQLGVPHHIHLHLTPQPVVIDDAVLLPAPLTRKSVSDDLTAYMDHVSSEPGALRVGLAHGSIMGLGREGDANNPIDPMRPVKAGLDYLALGDWHRTCQIGAAVWYSGTPEPDRAGGQERGCALLVDLPGPGAPAKVEIVPTGTYRWLTREERVTGSGDLADLDALMRAEGDLSRLVLRLRLAGALPLSGYSMLRRFCVDLEAALFHLEVDESAMVVRPSAADLESIDFDGALRRVADLLRAQAEDPAESEEGRRRAEQALIELYSRVVEQPHGATMPRRRQIMGRAGVAA